MSNSNNQPGFLAAFFGFKRMVSPTFITFFYYLGLIGILVGAAAAMLGKGPMSEQMMLSSLMGSGTAGAVGYYIGVVLFAIFLVLVWRFYCELLIVLFSIFNRLGDISSALKEQVVASPPPPAPVAVAPPAPAPVAAEDASVEDEKPSAEEGSEAHDESSDDASSDKKKDD